jgi:hypothetical protein
MTVQAPNVRVAITGEVYFAPAGTTGPTDSTTALAAAYKGLGYLSDDGVAEKWDDTVDTIVSWQNATTVRSATTKSVGSLGFTMIESNGLVLQTFHRGSTMVESPVGNFKLAVKPITADPKVWVFHVIDGTKLIRIHVGNGEITERGEVAYKNGIPIGYPVVLMCYPDSQGNLMNKFSNDTAWTAS